MKKERSMKIEDEEMFQKFCSDRELKKATIDGYKSSLQKYSEFTNMTLEEIIDEAEIEEESNIRIRKRKISKYLPNFKSKLDELDLAESSKNLIMVHVKAFYREFDIKVPKSKKRKIVKPSYQETIEDLPTMDEIQKFMEHCNSVYKAIILIGLSSGMGRAEIVSLTFKDFFNALSLETHYDTLPEIIDQAKSKGNLILFWNVKRQKTGNKYFTFSSPESLDRIIMYLEELYHNFPEYKPKPNDKLFRAIHSNKPLNTTNVGCMFNDISKRKGFRKANNRYVI
jgi:integrase